MGSGTGEPRFCEGARCTRSPARPPLRPTSRVTAMCRRIESNELIRIDFLAWIESNRNYFWRIGMLYSQCPIWLVQLRRTLFLNSNADFILLCFRDISFVRRNPRFQYLLPHSDQNFRVFPFEVDLWCWGLQTADSPANREIILEEFQPLWSKSTNAILTYRQTTYRVAAICVASRGKNHFIWYNSN